MNVKGEEKIRIRVLGEGKGERECGGQEKRKMEKEMGTRLSMGIRVLI